MTEEHPLDAENRRMCEELGAKPCPFCGGTPELFGSDRSGWEVDCAACNATGGGGETRADAVAAWNRRPADPLRDAAPDMLAALKAHVKASDDYQRFKGPEGDWSNMHALAMKLTRDAIAKAEEAQNQDETRKGTCNETPSCLTAHEPTEEMIKIGETTFRRFPMPFVTRVVIESVYDAMEAARVGEKG